ncbi:MAG TPA: SCO family protein [Flavobacteriales bacterium]|nr:SCO family protein [Flavobacteriales bacterium]
MGLFERITMRSKHYSTNWIGLAGVFVLAVGVGYWILAPEKSLPIIQPADLNPALVDPNRWAQTQHQVLPFELVNQMGDTVTEADVEGQVRIVDFFFTRCATLCPIMTSNMKGIQDALQGREGWRLMSHSVTPVADSVPILSQYANKYEADSLSWWFLTGSKKHIYSLARQSYFACYDEDQGGDGGWQDFIHTENMVLVDGQGRLRGFYDGTDLESVNQLIGDALWLIEKKD